MRLRFGVASQPPERHRPARKRNPWPTSSRSKSSTRSPAPPRSRAGCRCTHPGPTPGLFPNTAGREARRAEVSGRCTECTVAPDTKAKAPRDRYALTEKGWEFLLAAVNPKQVLEDFVRVLEARSGEVVELLDTARRMAESLQGLRDAVARAAQRECGEGAKTGTHPSRQTALLPSLVDPPPSPPPCREGGELG